MIPTIVIGVALVLGLVLVYSSLRIAREYERGVVFRLGRLTSRAPGCSSSCPWASTA